MIVAVFAAGLLFMQAQPAADPAAAPAAAPTPSGHPVSPVTVTSRKQQSGDLNPAEVICHSESVIGSRFPKKVCASRRELAERREQDQATAENFSRGTLNGGQPK
jgi:hypothetical protein